MKKNYFTKAALICAVSVSCFNLHGQCANPANIFSFNYNGKTYQVVKEKKNWIDAATCAVLKGGALAEINDNAELLGIYGGILNAGLTLTDTTAPDGGGASYVWIGGNDMSEDGKWIWDGNNDGIGTQFWQGDSNGASVGGLYQAWGSGGEPDNFNSNQNALGMSLSDWPKGEEGQWNDLSKDNMLYYVIEYNSILGTDDIKPKQEIESAQLYPNPVSDFLHIKTKKSMTAVILSDASGKKMKSVSLSNKLNETIDCRSLADGIYFVEIMYRDKTISKHKMIKTDQ